MTQPPHPPFAIRRLIPADAAEFRALRLEGLRAHPEAFGASWEDESGKPLSWFADRLDQAVVIGGFFQGGALAGVAGLFFPEAAKARHKAVLWGMYVCPAARGTGLAAALVADAIARARGVVEEIKLTVVASNSGAVGLYRSAGFREYGLERRGLKLGAVYYDELLMGLPLLEESNQSVT